MATGYIPNETGWSKQSSSPLYYTGWLRLYYSTSYNAANNTSTVTITPQFKSSTNAGNDYRFWADANTTDAGIWGGQTGSETKLYTLPTGGYSASGYLKCGQAHNGFVNITKSDGSAFSIQFPIQHNSSGAASFKAGIKCTVTTMLTPNQSGISNAGQKLCDNAVSITGSTYVLKTAVSPSGYGTVTAGATLAPTSTKSLTATPAATTAQYTYAFDSWTKTAGTLSSTSTNPTTFTMGSSDATVTANFKRTARSYTLTLNKNSYVASVSGGGSKVNGSSVTATATLGSATGYTYSFDGWYEGSTRKSTSLSYTFTMPASNYTLEARGSRTVNSYTATFTAGTNVASVSGGGSKNYGASVTATATLSTATGYHFSFDGWYEGSTRKSTSLSYTFTMPANNVSYTAKATKTANTYTVKFNKNNSSATGSTGDESFTYDTAKALTSNGFSLTGYDFKGWAETASGAVKYTDGQSVKNLTATNGGTVNLYAVWQEKTYTVSYNANGGTGAPSSQTKKYFSNLTLSSTKPTRASTTQATYEVSYNINFSGGTNPSAAQATKTRSYTFSKWNTAAGGGGTDYASGATYSTNANATMYAQWSSTDTTASVTLPSVSQTGYTFDGWYTQASGGTKRGGAGATYKPTQTETLYAHWTLKSYKLTISQGTGTTITVKRGNDTLANNATIYHFDELSIKIAVNTGYTIGTHKVNSTNWTTGSFQSYTVSGAVTVTATATPTEYTLSLTAPSTGVTVNVYRDSSSIGGASSGYLSNGAKIYYNDALTVSYAVTPGYELTTATVGGVSVIDQPQYNATVTGNLAIVFAVKVSAVAYIGSGTEFERYQIFIGNGTSWDQYQAYIGDGTNWVQY